MWRLRLFAKSWYWKTRLELWRFRWEQWRPYMFDCKGWALPPSNAQRNTIVRLGADLYVFRFRIGNKVFLKMYQIHN
jgi:hypothetical protein